MRCHDLLRKFDPRLSAGGGALRPRAAGLAVELLLRAVHAVRDSVPDDANAIAEQKRDDRSEYLGFPLAAAEEDEIDGGSASECFVQPAFVRLDSRTELDGLDGLFRTARLPLRRAEQLFDERGNVVCVHAPEVMGDQIVQRRLDVEFVRPRMLDLDDPQMRRRKSE